VIVRTRQGGRVELRSAAEWGSTDPWRLRLAGLYSTAGVAVNQDTVLGLPAATFCMRLVSMSVAGCDLQVVATSDPYNPTLLPDSWQYNLLHNPPASELTGFNLIADISAQIEGYGNSCIQKVKTVRPGMDGPVVDLVPLDMGKVKIYPDPKTGEKLFDLINQDGSVRTTDSSEILHVRGWSSGGGLVGMSPVQQHKAALGNYIAQQQYVGHFYRNNANPGGYIGLPEGADPDPKQMFEILSEWEEAHSRENFGRPAILANGARWETVGMSIADIAFLDGMRFAVDEIARMFYVPGSWVQPQTAERTPKIEEKFIELASYIEPRGKQIIAAFNADPDLFPRTEPVESRFDFSNLYHTDQQTGTQRVLWLRQGGVSSSNEARISVGLPPIDDPAYDMPILLPVGAGAVPGTILSGDGTMVNDQDVPEDEDMVTGNA
jgi:HK97 family phage portal protein